MSANDKQIGGEHYKSKPIQHWDLVVANNIPYLEARAIAYLMRWRDKGGVQDLHKAKHFVEKLIEVEELKAAEESKSKPEPESPEPTCEEWTRLAVGWGLPHWRCTDTIDGDWERSDGLVFNPGDGFVVEQLKQFDLRHPRD